MESWHPAALLGFFAAALVLTVVVQRLAFQVVAAAAALALLLSVRGAAAWRTVGALVPVVLAVALVNPLVNSQGATVIAMLPWGRPYTLEALLFGVQTGAMLATMLLWFASFNALVAGEKLSYLIGGSAPGAALVFSLVLQLVPRFQRRAQTVFAAFDGLGMGHGRGSAAQRVRQGARELSALTGWALEGSIVTADSMRARGFGSGRPMRLTVYRVGAAQAAAWAAMGLLLAVAVVGIAGGCATAQFVPVVSFPPPDGLFCASLVSFTLFLAMPSLVNAAERLRWRLSLSRI